MAGFPGMVLLVVGFCRSLEPHAAVVAVDESTGASKVVDSWALPFLKDCAFPVGPRVDVDDGGELALLEFETGDGGWFFTLVSLKAGGGLLWWARVADRSFAGAYDFFYDPAASRAYGITTTITSAGYCDDGCFEVGYGQFPAARWVNLTNTHYRDVSANTHFWDRGRGSMWFQLAPNHLAPSGFLELRVSDAAQLRFIATNNTQFVTVGGGAPPVLCVAAVDAQCAGGVAFALLDLSPPGGGASCPARACRRRWTLASGSRAFPRTGPAGPPRRATRRSAAPSCSWPTPPLARRCSTRGWPAWARDSPPTGRSSSCGPSRSEPGSSRGFEMVA